MKIEIPLPQPRSDSDFGVWVSKGYGDPHGTIALDEKWELSLNYVSAEDCDQLIRAAAEIKSKVLAYRAELGVPHGTAHLHKGRCQLCGKPEDDELHAEPEPLVISDSTIAQAEFFAQPGNTVADVLAEQRAAS